MKGLKSIHKHCALTVTKLRQKVGGKERYSKFSLNSFITLDSTANDMKFNQVMKNKRITRNFNFLE